MNETSRFPLAAIQERVAREFGVTRADLVGPTRRHAVTRPRQVAMYLACALTQNSLPMIGRAFGRDHTTVMYSVRVLPQYLARDAALRARVERLQGDLTRPTGEDR